MDGKISVIIGAYNAEEHVVRCVLSVLNQTEKNVEVIIVDDGSTDHTYELLKELADEYPQIILLRNEKNVGLAASLNHSLEYVSGDYIARMDVDDYCVPERFEVQKRFLEEHSEYDLVGSEMIMVDENGKETYYHSEREPDESCLPMRVPFLHPTVLMRRHVLERLGGYKEAKHTRRCEDLELWYRFFHLGMRGYNLPDYLYIKSEGITDYKKRKAIYGFDMWKTHIKGLRLLHAKPSRYFLAFKPVISALIPKRIMMKYHEIKFKEPVKK